MEFPGLVAIGAMQSSAANSGPKRPIEHPTRIDTSFGASLERVLEKQTESDEACATGI